MGRLGKIRTCNLQPNWLLLYHTGATKRLHFYFAYFDALTNRSEVCFSKVSLSPSTGLEPWTSALQVRRSEPTELQGQTNSLSSDSVVTVSFFVFTLLTCR